MLRNIFGCRSDEVAVEWRRWHSEDIRDLYCWPILLWWSYKEEQGVWVCGKNGVGAYTGFGGETWGKGPLESPRCWWEDNIKWICKILHEFVLRCSFFGWRLLWKPQWITGLREMCGIASVTEVLLVSQGSFCFVELVIILYKLTDCLRVWNASEVINRKLVF